MLWKHIESLVPRLPAIGFDAVAINWIIMEQNFDQILAVAKQVDSGVPVAELNCQVGISQQTLHCWQRQDTYLEVDWVPRCRRTC